MKNSSKLLRIVRHAVRDWRQGKLSPESGMFLLSLFVYKDSPTKEHIKLAQQMFKIYRKSDVLERKIKI